MPERGVQPNTPTSEEMMEYRYVWVACYEDNFSERTETVNRLLGEGWVPVRETATSSGHSRVSTCLVLLKRERKENVSS